MKKTIIYSIASVALYMASMKLKKLIDEEGATKKLDSDVQVDELEITEEEIVECKEHFDQRRIH